MTEPDLLVTFYTDARSGYVWKWRVADIDTGFILAVSWSGFDNLTECVESAYRVMGEISAVATAAALAREGR